MCATRQEVDKLHKYLKQEQGIAEGALVCNGDMYTCQNGLFEAISN
jgi:hypothetical protein